jgi:hypothetical protein
VETTDARQAKLVICDQASEKPRFHTGASEAQCGSARADTGIIWTAQYAQIRIQSWLFATLRDQREGIDHNRDLQG